MRTYDRAKAAPEIGHSTERLVEDKRLKQKTKTQAGTAICDRCRAVGMHKHWFVDHSLSERLAADPLVRFVVCPGCKRIEDRMYEGEVTLDSPLLIANKEMIYGTLYHEAMKGFIRNPLSRIALIEDRGDMIRIVTTTCTLAGRLGKAIHKALKGKIEIKPSPGERFVFVKWYRHDI
jgi:NMD protein affecting ribosome stability and mRNA decay